jgi:hypothetical protein
MQTSITPKQNRPWLVIIPFVGSILCLILFVAFGYIDGRTNGQIEHSLLLLCVSFGLGLLLVPVSVVLALHQFRSRAVSGLLIMLILGLWTYGCMDRHPLRDFQSGYEAWVRDHVSVTNVRAWRKSLKVTAFLSPVPDYLPGDTEKPDYGKWAPIAPTDWSSDIKALSPSSVWIRNDAEYTLFLWQGTMTAEQRLVFIGTPEAELPAELNPPYSVDWKKTEPGMYLAIIIHP